MIIMRHNCTTQSCFEVKDPSIPEPSTHITVSISSDISPQQSGIQIAGRLSNRRNRSAKAPDPINYFPTTHRHPPSYLYKHSTATTATAVRKFVSYSTCETSYTVRSPVKQASNETSDSQDKPTKRRSSQARHSRTIPSCNSSQSQR